MSAERSAQGEGGMVERVANAMRQATHEWRRRPLALESPDPAEYSLAYQHFIARAAIEALREPTEGMIEAAWDAGGVGDCGGLERADPEGEWRAMIAAALSPAEGRG